METAARSARDEQGAAEIEHLRRGCELGDGSSCGSWVVRVDATQVDPSAYAAAAIRGCAHRDRNACWHAAEAFALGRGVPKSAAWSLVRRYEACKLGSFSACAAVAAARPDPILRSYLCDEWSDPAACTEEGLARLSIQIPAAGGTDDARQQLAAVLARVSFDRTTIEVLEKGCKGGDARACAALAARDPVE